MFLIVLHNTILHYRIFFLTDAEGVLKRVQILSFVNQCIAVYVFDATVVHDVHSVHTSFSLISRFLH